ncbi:MAG TPA: ATP-dependent 6-phosphofructokinase [Anaerolineaceae bacterium]|jgi:6-phosphofructokinase 1|nr:ATP-dependent 6-phosphofructokinase [Anaerolineaceae bacterium]HPT22966.1 ATP-dependent 6-phosphofructokinase [Anaerolineaceae bacterium]
MATKVGILTAGSDSPGVNAAIRGFGKAAQGSFNMEVIGFRDGYEGLVEDHATDLSAEAALSGILTLGGTILGTSLNMPQAMPSPSGPANLTQQAVDTYHRHNLDALVVIGDKRAQNAAYLLSQQGLNIVTMPKAADNDIPGTDKAIGYDSAREIATQAIDRLHTTATATHRIMLVELIGNAAGWLTLGAGLAAGADVILIPEIPYEYDVVIQAILKRKQVGRKFSLVAVAERARSRELVEFMSFAARKKSQTAEEEEKELERIEGNYSAQTLLLARRLEEATGLDTRITILGSLVRGGTPTSADRLLATQLAEWSALMVSRGEFGRMACRKNGAMDSVLLQEIAGRSKPIPMDHGWIRGAYQVGVCLGVEQSSLGLPE